MSELKILVVDDEEAMREVLKMRLGSWGYQVLLASDVETAGKLVESEQPALVLSDVVMPERSGLDLLRLLQGEDPSRPVILMTAHGSVDMAVEAMKAGARDFLTKPLDPARLKAVLEEAVKELELRRRSRQLTEKVRKEAGLGPLVGESAPMRELFHLIEEVAPSGAPVLIWGESGTGKELVARVIHQLSPRAQGPFVAVNAAAIPQELMESEIFGHERGAFTGATGVRAGCFEMAHQGTLFLDEIAEMPLALQPKLLRVLEDGKVRRLGGKKEFEFQVRLLSATNRVPQEALQEGRLREDLYYRLNVFSLEVPPLRRRPEDIPLLAQHFVRLFNRKHKTQVEGLRPAALELLQNFHWPGNVRELRNVLERAVVLAKGEWIEASHLPPYFREQKPSPSGPEGERLVLPLGISAAEAERELILKTLELTGHNKAEAARRLGLDVKTIRNKLKSYGLS